MATVNIGSLKFNWKGAYNGSTAYAVDDVTEYNGSSYICILASTGNLPTNTTYFQPMATKGTDGTDVGTTLTTQGDILYRDGSGLQRLAAGTNGQVLQTGGSGANPSWGTVSSDYVKLATGTIGNVSSISIDGYFTSDYDYYKLIIMNNRNDTANRQLFWRFNQGGSALSASNYRHASKGNYTNSSTGNNDTATSGWGVAQFNFGWDGSTGSDRGSQYEINIYDPLSTTNNKFCTYWGTMDVQDASYISSMFGGGYYNDGGATALTGITILPQADNFNTGGKWKLYGIKG